MNGIVRRVRAAVIGAVVTGAGWFATALVLATAMWAAGLMHDASNPLDSLLVALRFGFVGAFAGALFSLLIGVLYDGRSILEIPLRRFASLGAIAGGLLVVAWVTIPRALGGESLLPLTSILRNGLLAAVIGGTVAAVTLKMAQYADRRLPPGDDHDLLGAGGLGGAVANSMGQRSALYNRGSRRR